MRSILRHISTHIQVGYVACLALGIAILCTLAICEAFRAYLIGIDPFLPFTIAVPPTTFLFAIIYSGCLLVILPVCLAPLIALSRGRTVLTRILRARGRQWNTSILVLGLLNALLFIYISSLQRFGGVSVLLNRPHDSVYALSSVFLWLEQHIPKYLILGVPIAVSIITASHHIFGRPKTQSFENYLGRLEYHALPMRFAPIHGRRRLNFNTGGLAPVLRGIRKQMLRDMDG